MGNGIEPFHAHLTARRAFSGLYRKYSARLCFPGIGKREEKVREHFA